MTIAFDKIRGGAVDRFMVVIDHRNPAPDRFRAGLARRRSLEQARRGEVFGRARVAGQVGSGAVD